MRRIYVTLVSMLVASLATTAWADPGKDESGKGGYESYGHYEDYREAEREAWKRRREHEREAAKAWAEMEREERKRYEEMQREERKHREEMRRDAHKHDKEMRRESYFETIVYVPWYD